MMFFQRTILDSVIIYISSIPNELEVQDTTDTYRSASYVDIHTEIDNGERLKTKLYDKRGDFASSITVNTFTDLTI